MGTKQIQMKVRDNMARKIIRFTPDQMGYKDRGKMKWSGLMLSDHAESLNRMMIEEKNVDVALKPKQSLVEISERLAEAYLSKKPVSVQFNIIQDGTYFKDIHCLVSGTFEQQILLVLKDGRVIDVPLKDIRYIEFVESDVWYQKR